MFPLANGEKTETKGLRSRNKQTETLEQRRRAASSDFYLGEVNPPHSQPCLSFPTSPPASVHEPLPCQRGGHVQHLHSPHPLGRDHDSPNHMPGPPASMDEVKFGTADMSIPYAPATALSTI